MRTTSAGFKDGKVARANELLVRYGPTVRVHIGFDENLNTSHPDLPIKDAKALIDTGAGDNCIDNDLAMQLNLPVFDRRPLSGIHGMFQANIFLAQVYIPSLHHVINQAFAGVALAAGGQPCQVLLGRTFLQHFTMRYEGTTGRVVIADYEA